MMRTDILKQATTMRWKMAHTCGTVLFVVIVPMMAQNATVPAWQTTSAPAPQKLATKVVMLPPVVNVETLPSGGQTGGLAGSAFGSGSVASTGGLAGQRRGSKSDPAGSFDEVLVSAAKAHLNEQGYTLLSLDDVQDPSVSDLLRQLEPLTNRLAHGAINDQAREVLNHLSTLPENYLVFVQFMEVKEGPGGSWNPNTGAITSAMFSTLVRAALISTRTGTVIWKDENLERKLFHTNDPKFGKFLDQIYSTLASQGGNQ